MLVAAAFTATFVFVVAVHTTHHVRDSQTLKTKSENLVQSLRRKLIKDNYDYVTGNTEDTVNYRANNKFDKELENTSKVTTKPTHRKKLSTYRVKTNYYVSKLYITPYTYDDRFLQISKNKDNGVREKEDITVSRKDLLYYVDDESLSIKKTNNVEISKHQDVTASVKYKVLKTKHKNYRRKGQAQFIQEESKDGFAIVKLGDGPFPALRLPLARRQYMRDGAAVGSDEEEIPPPSVSREGSPEDIVGALMTSAP